MTGTLLVRADGGGPMGAGHVMRQLALAQAWAGHGGRVVLATANLAGAPATRWSDSGFEVRQLPARPADDEDGSRPGGLPPRFRADGQERSGRCLDRRPEEPDWVSFDGYHLHPRLQEEVARAGHRLLVVDDHGAVGHYCADVIVDQNLGATAADYAARPPGSVVLLGPRYALLRREFGHDPPARSVASGKPLRVLLTLGGSPDVALLAVIRRGVGEVRCAPEVVEAGPGMPVADMAALMASCDVAVSAAGSTCWELCAAGLPAALVVTAPNQGAQGVLRRMQRTLTDEQRQVLRELGAATRAEVARAAERFALPCREQDETRIIDAVLSTMWVALWVALQETGPSTLRGYGALGPDAADALAPHLATLIDLVERMRAVLLS